MVCLIKLYRKPILISLIFFLSLFLTVMYTITPSKENYVLSTWSVVEDPSGIFKGNSKAGRFYYVLKEPNYVIIEAAIPEEVFKNTNQNYLYLFIPQVDTSYFEIYADKELLGFYGDYISKTAHLWYQPIAYPISKDTKKIHLKIYGVYEVGLDFAPFLTNSLVRYNILYFITTIFIPIFIGMALMNGVILFFISRNIEENKKEYYKRIFLSTIFGVIWMFDTIPFENMGNELVMLVFRKFFVSSAYIGFAFLILGFTHSYNLGKRLLNRIVIFINTLAAFIILIAPSNYYLKVITSNVSPLLIFNAIYLFYTILYSYSNILFGFTTFFVLTTIHDSILLFLSINSKFLSPFGVVAVFSGYAYNLISEYKQLAVKERLSHIRSITDQLTGAFNRGYLNEITLNKSDCLLFIDLNKFKVINDKYGHEVGDTILKNLVFSIKNNIQASNIVVRMGGDEFLIVLRNSTEDRANEIAKRILNDFTNSHELKPTFSYGVRIVGDNLSESIRKADFLMYKMKEETKKNSS